MNSSSESSLSSSCFYPNTSGEEAETILKSVGKHGSFLLRLCSRVNGHHHYTLSVMSNKHIIHFKMQCSNGYYSIRSEGEFESPYDVIQNCVENPDILKEKDGSIIELKQPVVNSKKPTRWCHDNIHQKDAERILNENGKHGSFLVRASYRHPGDYALCVRLKDEIFCVKIYANGEKFDIGAGKQFKTISDLILHYKKYPLKTNTGVDIHLDQGIDTDSIKQGSSVKYGAKIPSINWNPPTVATLSTVCTNDRGCQGKAIGMMQVCKDQNGDMAINLNGHDDCYSKFKMYKSLIQDDPNSNGIYCIICLESYAYPGNYLHWTNSNKESVEIYSCTNGGKMPPSSIREICWFRHSLQPDVCDCTQSIEAKATRDVSDLSISDNNEVHKCPLADSDETHKLVAWRSPPYQQNINKHTQYYYLTFNATKHEPEDHAAKLTPEFSLSSNVIFSDDTDV